MFLPYLTVYYFRYFTTASFTFCQPSLFKVDSMEFIFSSQALTKTLTWVLPQLSWFFFWVLTLWIFLRYYFHYWVVAAAGTAVDSVGNFRTYNDDVLVVMSVGIVYYAARVSVIVGVNWYNFYLTFFFFHLQYLLFSKVLVLY